MTENKNIYKGLECHCSEFEKIPTNRKDLEMYGEVVTYGIAVTQGYAVYELDRYFKQENIGKWGQKSARTLIKMNRGILSFFQGKIEGKSNKRAAIEAGVGFIIGEITTSTLVVKTGISLLTRMGVGAATGATMGSAFPIAGTIVGAIAGALIAGIINDAIFKEEDKQLANSKAQNEIIDKLSQQYQDKINQINECLIKNNYSELRELNEQESEMLCKALTDLNQTPMQNIELMHSFPHYLRRDSNPFSSLHPLNPSHSPLLNSYSKDSNTSTLYNPTPYCNPHPSSEESIDFKLEIKDYDTFMPLENKTIQIKNIDSKETYIQTTNSKGEVLFTLKEEERGEFFHILLLNDKDYEQEPYHLARKTITNTQGQKTIKQTTQKILTPNSYPNYPARLFFKSKQKLSFYFDDNTLFVLKCKKVLGAYDARSGKALNQ